MTQRAPQAGLCPTGPWGGRVSIAPGSSGHKLVGRPFIEAREPRRPAHCPRGPRPSTAWATAPVTASVTVAVTSFTTFSPESWAFFRASATAGRGRERGGERAAVEEGGATARGPAAPRSRGVLPVLLYCPSFMAEGWEGPYWGVYRAHLGCHGLVPTHRPPRLSQPLPTADTGMASRPRPRP